MFKKKGVDHINTTYTDCLAWQLPISINSSPVSWVGKLNGMLLQFPTICNQYGQNERSTRMKSTLDLFVAINLPWIPGKHTERSVGEFNLSPVPVINVISGLFHDHEYQKN